MTTIQEKLIKQRKHLFFIQKKVDKGCKLFNEDMPVEAEIAFSEAMQFSEELVMNHPDDLTYQLILVETHHILSLGFTSIKEYDKAFTHIHAALSIFEKVKGNDFLYELTLQSSLARIEQVAGHHKEAVSILEKVIRCFETHPKNRFIPDDFIYCSDKILLASECFDIDLYETAGEITKQIIEHRHQYSQSILNQKPKEYLDLLDLAASKAAEHDHIEFQLQLLKEGIATCNQARAKGKKVNLFTQSAFYQNIINVYFFRNEKEALKDYYSEMIQFCDSHFQEEPRLKVFKISTLLNYAVFCVKNGDGQEAEEIVESAIDGCMEMGDEEGPEQTIFLVSALQTMSNMRYQQGAFDEALHDLDSGCNILKNYLDSHPEMKPNLYTFFIDMIRSQVMLCHKIGQPERGENLLESLLSEYHLAPEDYQQPGIAPYMVALKKKADIHWDLGNIDKAKEEYQEVLYILGNMHEFCPELSENVLAIEQEIKETLGASEVGGG